MNKIKAILKKIVQNKTLSLNYLLAEHLETQVAYRCRTEHLTHCVLSSSEPGISGEKHGNDEIVVSLTTHGKRLHEVYLAIESIMQQSLRPNRIVLWLGNELKNETLPLVLQRQQKRGLEIRYCEDIKSYTKLIPSLKHFPSSAVITIDDDYLYHFDLIENLVNAHIKKPGYIYCSRMHRIKLKPSGIPDKYEKWLWDYDSFDVSSLNFATGAGGVLYPPHCFNEEVFNEKVFMDICKYADDIWFKAMGLINNISVQKIYIQGGNTKHNLENVQNISLSRINNEKGMNDVQIKAVFDKYNLYERLKT